MSTDTPESDGYFYDEEELRMLCRDMERKRDQYREALQELVDFWPLPPELESTVKRIEELLKQP